MNDRYQEVASVIENGAKFWLFHKLTAFGRTFLATLPIFAIITNSYTIKLRQKGHVSCEHWPRRLAGLIQEISARERCDMVLLGL